MSAAQSGPLAALKLDPENQATQLVELARQHFELFHSNDGRSWAVEKNGPNVAIPLGRRGRFSKRLGRRYVEAMHKAPGDQAVGDATRIIEAFLEDEDPREVFLRVGRYQSSIVLDLGRADGQRVIVDSDGWKVEDRSPVPFRRGKTGPLPVPARGEGLTALGRLCNADTRAFRLATACLVAYLVPGIPYPILVVRGEQGTAKTTFVKMLMRSIDPGRDPGPLPRDERNFSIRMWNGHIHAFDNLRDIAPYQSDMLCRAATGDDFGERTLYSDDEMTSMPFRRPLLLNGIDLGAASPDLTDRAVPIILTKIPEGRRRAERTVLGDDDGNDPGVLDEFDKAHPAVLADLLDILADVLKFLPKVGRITLPRMADFGKVLAAMDLRYTETHGHPHSQPLLEMFSKLSREAVADSAKDDVVGNAILEFVKGRTEWEGTTSGLLGELEGRLPRPAPERMPRGWPANVQSFGRRIPKLNPALRANGWEIIQAEHTDKGRRLYLQPYRLAGADSSDSSDSSDVASDLRKRTDEWADESGPTDEWADDLTSPDESDFATRQVRRPAETDRSDESDEPSPMIAGTGAPADLHRIRCPQCRWQFKTAVRPGEAAWCKKCSSQFATLKGSSP
jgi:hypothetical protein